MRDGEYQLRDLGDGRFRLTNRSVGLRALIGPDGAVLVPRAADADAPEWSLGVRTIGVGRGEARAVTAGRVREGACVGAAVDELGGCLKRAEQDLGPALGWWANTPNGVQQGWVLDAPPARPRTARATGSPKAGA